MAKLSTLKPRLQSLGSPLRGTKAAVNRDQRRDASQPWRAWYKTARWQKLRMRVLRRDAVDIKDRPDLMPLFVLFKGEPWLWPECHETGAILVGKHPAPNSPVVDHIVPHRGDETLFWNLGNLQTVSKAYHDSVKQRIESSGRY